MKQTAHLQSDVEFDDTATDAESMAIAADTLLDNALSTDGILDDYASDEFGSPNFGQVTVATSNLSLAREVFNAMFQEHETFHDDDLGAYLAYLMGAIIAEPDEQSSIDLFMDSEQGDVEFLAALKRLFPVGHAVWKFVNVYES